MTFSFRRQNRRELRKSRITRFLGSFMILIGASWLTYHLLTTMAFVDKPASTLSAQNQNTNVAAPIVDTIAPEVIEASEPEPEWDLLAAPAYGKNIKEKPAAPVAVEAKPNVEAKVKPEPKKESPAQKILSKANTLMDDGKTIEARNILKDYLAEHFEEESSEALRDRAVEIGDQTILSLKVYPDDKLASYYTVKTGDNMVNIARKCKVPYQFICRINHIDDPRRLRVGQKIKLVQGPVRLKVRKTDLKMYVFLQDTLFAKYEVGLGKNNKTPVGRWMVEDRIQRPLYVDPDTNKVYGPNDKDNPTGGYWLRLKGIEGETIGRTGFGIHGTTEPESIGKFMSKGCVRMRNEEVAEVFDMLVPGESDVYTLP